MQGPAAGFMVKFSEDRNNSAENPEDAPTRKETDAILAFAEEWVNTGMLVAICDCSFLSCWLCICVYWVITACFMVCRD